MRQLHVDFRTPILLSFFRPSGARSICAVSSGLTPGANIGLTLRVTQTAAVEPELSQYGVSQVRYDKLVRH